MLIIYICDEDTHAQLSNVSIIIDGNRIVLSDGRKIILMGIDAPEKHSSVKLARDALMTGRSEERVMQQGRRAAEFLTRISGGYPVLVIVSGEVDTAGYLPAFVYLTNRAGQPQFCLNQKMIEKGYAVADLTFDYPEARLYVRLEKISRESRQGLWAETIILVEPQKINHRATGPGIFAGDCARDTACVWVSAGGLSLDAGMWESKPGRKCACVKE